MTDWKSKSVEKPAAFHGREKFCSVKKSCRCFETQPQTLQHVIVALVKFSMSGETKVTCFPFVPPQR